MLPASWHLLCRKKLIRTPNLPVYMTWMDMNGMKASLPNLMSQWALQDLSPFADWLAVYQETQSKPSRIPLFDSSRVFRKDGTYQKMPLCLTKVNSISSKSLWVVPLKGIAARSHQLALARPICLSSFESHGSQESSWEESQKGNPRQRYQHVA